MELIRFHAMLSVFLLVVANVGFGVRVFVDVIVDIDVDVFEYRFISHPGDVELQVRLDETPVRVLCPK